MARLEGFGKLKKKNAEVQNLDRKVWNNEVLREM
jgi:hypothetical protein